jgi:DNA polymerase II
MSANNLAGADVVECAVVGTGDPGGLHPPADGGLGGVQAATVTGWLLDLYADPEGELVLWIIQDDNPCRGMSHPERPNEFGSRRTTRPYARLRLRQSFPITFYAAGPNPRLRLLWQRLSALASSFPLALSRQERRDLFLPQPVTVLAVEVQKPGHLPEVFRRAAAAFPDLTYYDADLLLTARHAAVYGTFPLARLRLAVEAGTEYRVSEPAMVRTLQVLDSPWDLDAPPPPLRLMRLSPDCDPRRAEPAWLEVTVETPWSVFSNAAGAAAGGLSAIEGAPSARTSSAIEGRRRRVCRLSLQPERALLVGLRALLVRYDPDLLLTAWGDTWLLPHLLDLSEKLGLPLPLNRGASGEAFGGASISADDVVGAGSTPPQIPCDARQPILRRPERSYHAYGQVIYRGQQVLLSGRWHIDMFNAMMFHDYALDGILESARVSAMPVQQAARLSPGTGISTMQIVTALRQGVMTPWRKQQAEIPKTALDLLRADQGGLVYQPVIGLHRDVAEIDFISMYPSIMARFNISPETTEVVATDSPNVVMAPLQSLRIDQSRPGLVPQTLQPLLDKRIALKHRLAELPGWDPRKKLYQARAAAHKWLLVTCFGYLGYKNARFGRIEAHQAVTAYSRECLLLAKEAAEDLGYTVLHMYVDGLWVSRASVGAGLDADNRRGGSANAIPCRQHEPRPAPTTNALTVQDVQPLLDEIARRTGLPIALEGIYRWVAFLPSRSDERLSVANRYFGLFQDGSLKLRGLEARRGDTPPFIAAVQLGLLDRLANLPQVLEPA